MEVNKIPNILAYENETGCCPILKPEEWDDKKFVFDKKLFALGKTINLLHMPLNMAGMMTKSWKKITDAKADSKNEFILLSYDPSAWRGEHYFSVTKKVPGMEMSEISGTFITKVFEGPYKDAGKWVKEMEKFVKSKNEKLKKLYLFYTTCPKCAKHYGKNYTVGFAEIS